MKTPEQFLREVIKYFPDDYVLDTPDEGISIHMLIRAMEDYAQQYIDNHVWRESKLILKLQEEELQNTHLAQKCSDLADEQSRWHNAFKELSKSHIVQEETARYNDVLAQGYKTIWEDEANKLNKMEGRANALEEWLTEYRDQLKKENAYYKNQGIINAINELLDETKE